MNKIRTAIIGLDTSHSIQFTMRAQAPDCPPDQKVEGLQIVTCMRFETPFQDKKGLDERQAQLEKWGVKVTESFDEAVAECDAIMLEINDPSLHVEYFEKAVRLGKPMFLDKPLADNIQNGLEIYETAKMYDAKVFSSSSLRFVPEVIQAAGSVKDPQAASVTGPVGIAMAGESIIWYGVHTFEMLQRLMGRGAVTVRALKDRKGIVAIVQYQDGRRGIVELNENVFSIYAGSIRNDEIIRTYTVDMNMAYKSLLVETVKFFSGGPAPVDLKDTLEVMDMLDAAARSLKTGNTENLTAV